MTGRIHKNVLKELKRRHDHTKKKSTSKDDNIHGRDTVQSMRITNTKNK